MKLSNFRFFIALMLFLVPVGAVSQDSLANEKYERRMQTRDNMWRSLIPDITVLQFAGGTGMFSLGTGWVYGKSDNWETTVNLGFIPRKYNDRPYWVFSLAHCARSYASRGASALRHIRVEFNPSRRFLDQRTGPLPQRLLWLFLKDKGAYRGGTAFFAEHPL